MECVTGQVVASRQGRDVTRLYAVVGRQGERLLLADGKKHLLAAPKHKNPRHVQPTGTVLPPQDMETDLKLKTALRLYAEGRGESQQGG